MKSLTVGFPISLSGRYAVQGAESLKGIKLWQAEINSNSGIFVEDLYNALPVELIYYDDQSSEEHSAEITEKILTKHKPDFFLGPYSSGLAVAIAPITKKLNRVVWNYGAATDELMESGFTNFINAITPSSHYYHGLIDYFSEKLTKADKTMAIVYASDSGFSSRVMQGAKQHGEDNNFTISEFSYLSGRVDFTDIISGLIDLKPDIILGVGRMEDDLNFARLIIKSKELLTKNIAVLAASIDHFKEVMGADADGFLSTVQWEKNIELQPDFGPTSSEFNSLYLRTYCREPGYLAAQAYNIGLIIEQCIHMSGTLDEQKVLDSAMKLDISTFYGRFKIDKKSGVQIGHNMYTVRWANGLKELLLN